MKKQKLRWCELAKKKLEAMELVSPSQCASEDKRPFPLFHHQTNAI